MANEWFYAKDDQKFGPVSGKRLKELALIGAVGRNDLIWSPGYAVWRPAKKFRGLLPRMDATSINPAMSLFWRPGTVEGVGDDRMKGMFLDPDSPATLVTPPLPPSASRRGSVNGSSVATLTAPGSPATLRTIRKRPSAAGTAESTGTSAPTASASRVSARQTAEKPVISTAAPAKGAWGRLTGKEKLAITGGLLTMLAIYGVLLLKVLL